VEDLRISCPVKLKDELKGDCGIGVLVRCPENLPNVGIDVPSFSVI